MFKKNLLMPILALSYVASSAQLIVPKKITSKLQDTSYLTKAQMLTINFSKLVLRKIKLDSVVNFCQVPFYWNDKITILNTIELKDKFRNIYEEKVRLSPQYLDSIYVTTTHPGKKILPGVVYVTFNVKYRNNEEKEVEKSKKVIFIVTKSLPIKIQGIIE